MKITKWMIPVTLMVMSGLMAGQSPQNPRAHAQTATFEASVPFEFVVGQQTLPPGKYQIQRLTGPPSEAAVVGIIVLRSSDPPVYRAVVTTLVKQSLDWPDKAGLVFTRHAEQYYLREVRIEGEKGHGIPNVSPASEPFRLDTYREEVALKELR